MYGSLSGNAKLVALGLLLLGKLTEEIYLVLAGRFPLEIALERTLKVRLNINIECLRLQL